MPPCQVCLSHGVAGEAIPGSAFCAAHGAAGSAPPSQPPMAAPVAAPMDTEDGGSGATQGMASLHVGATVDSGVA